MIALWVVVGLAVLLLYGLLARTAWLVYRDHNTPKAWRTGTIWANFFPSVGDFLFLAKTTAWLTSFFSQLMFFVYL